MTVRVALIGASGRAGTEVLRALSSFPELTLAAAVVSSGSRVRGQRVPFVASSELAFTDDLESAVRGADCVLEFSSPDASVRAVELAAADGKPIVVASTGHTPEQLATIRRCAEKTALLQASNLSLGVFALKQLCSQAQRILGAEYEIEIVELHHKHKKDAPSGTALSVARVLAEQGGLEVVPVRGAVSGSRAPGSLGIASIRAGDILGEHTVYFCGPGERLELTHRTSDRGVFARGGLRALLSLIRRPAGLYELADLIE